MQMILSPINTATITDHIQGFYQVSEKLKRMSWHISKATFFSHILRHFQNRFTVWPEGFVASNCVNAKLSFIVEDKKKVLGALFIFIVHRRRKGEEKSSFIRSSILRAARSSMSVNVGDRPSCITAVSPICWAFPHL